MVLLCIRHLPCAAVWCLCHRSSAISLSYLGLSVVLFGVGFVRAWRGQALDYRLPDAAKHDERWAQQVAQLVAMRRCDTDHGPYYSDAHPCAAEAAAAAGMASVAANV